METHASGQSPLKTLIFGNSSQNLRKKTYIKVLWSCPVLFDFFYPWQNILPVVGTMPAISRDHLLRSLLNDFVNPRHNYII